MSTATPSQIALQIARSLQQFISNEVLISFKLSDFYHPMASLASNQCLTSIHLLHLQYLDKRPLQVVEEQIGAVS